MKLRGTRCLPAALHFIANAFSAWQLPNWRSLRNGRSNFSLFPDALNKAFIPLGAFRMKLQRLLLVHIVVLSCVAQKDIYSLLSQKSRRPPTENATRALDVKLGMYLESLGNFRSTEMSFDVDLYVYMSWRDSRLAHNFSDYVLINDDKIRQQIWLPDLYFANARQAHFQEVTVPNFNLFVAPDGTIAYSCRCTLTVACSLDLRFYPMDAQLCSIRVLSYAYIAKKVNVTWFRENPIRYNPEIGLPEFHIEHVTKGYCNGTYRYALTPDAYKLDDFSCLTGNLYLSRSIGYNLVQSYIPTGLIVMISWVSFWIDRRAVPARVTLSFTTLVSLTTLGNGLRFGLPQVSYAKAIDLWYGACMLFVFCALLEFATINSYMRKAEKFEGMAKKMQFAIHTARIEAKKVPEPKEEWSPYVTENGGARNRARCRTNSLDIGSRQRSHEPFCAQEHELQNMINEKISYIDSGYELHPRSKGGRNTMSIYDNVSCRRNDEDSRSSDGETQFGSRVAPGPYIENRMSNNNNNVQHESILASTYLQVSKTHSRHALKIDKTCRYLFPLAFLIWNVFYWWYYLVYQKVAIVEE